MLIKNIGEGVFNLISWFDMDKVGKATIMVVGAGALGNEVLKNLALLGVGRIIIVDFDRIEYTNLCRSVLFRTDDAQRQEYKSKVAAKRVKELNPGIEVIALNGDVEKEIGLGYFRASDVIISCLDSMIARYIVNNYSFLMGKPWIDGGIKNLDGYATVYKQGESCYACSLSDDALQSLNIRLGCADVFTENISFGRVATTPVSASIIGALQAQEALKIIHGYSDNHSFENEQKCNTLAGKTFYYEGMNLESYSIMTSDYFDDCPHHNTWDNIIEDNEISILMTLDEFFKYLESKYDMKKIKIHLRNPFVSHILIKPPDKKYEVLLPDSKIEDFIIKNNIVTNIDETIYKLPSPEGGYRIIDDDFKWRNLTLEKIGIPKFDVLMVETEDKNYYIEFSGERWQ